MTPLPTRYNPATLALEQSRAQTLVKKIVGTLGAALASGALYLADPAHVAMLQKLAAGHERVVLVIGFLGAIAAWWGKHPLAQPSVATPT